MVRQYNAAGRGQVPDISQQARLLRGFATDFLTSHDTGEVRRIMSPDYRLSIGGVTFEGRDGAYLPATAAQLDEFPGLCVTVHDTILSPGAVAMRFTEHGVSSKLPGRGSAWGGITLFEIEDGRLRRGWAEEDYFARKRQLKSGIPDPVAAPCIAPWDNPCLDEDPQVVEVASVWLSDPAFVARCAVEEIRVGGPRFADLVSGTNVALNKVFSAGRRAAFHVGIDGKYAGGFGDVEPHLVGTPVTLRLAGILDVEDGAVVRAQISADRLGLYRQLMPRRES